MADSKEVRENVRTLELQLKCIQGEIKAALKVLEKLVSELPKG